MTRDPRLRPAPGVHMFPLDTGALLFHETAQEFYVLNPMAAMIWCWLEDHRDAQGMADALADALRIDGARAVEFVNAALDDWATKGFLSQGSAPAASSRAMPPASRKEHATPPTGAGRFVAERCYQLLESRMRVRFTDLAQQALVHPVLAHLEADCDGATDLLEIVAGDHGTAVYRDGEARGDNFAAIELAPFVKGEIWEAALASDDFLFGVHAGVVGTPGGCILMPGPAGSGKSTLTAGLVYAGFDYYSDELALLREDTLDVSPFPIACCVKESGIDALASLFPALRALPLHLRAGGRRVAYLPPPEGSVPRPLDRRRVRAIIYPEFNATAETRWQPLTKSESLRQLLAQCLIVRRRPSIDAVRAFVAWIERLEHVKLTFNNLPSAISLIVSHLA